MRVFVPSDDGPIDAALVAQMVPYRCGLACEHGLRDRSRDRQAQPASHPRPAARTALSGDGAVVDAGVEILGA